MTGVLCFLLPPAAALAIARLGRREKRPAILDVGQGCLYAFLILAVVSIAMLPADRAAMRVFWDGHGGAYLYVQYGQMAMLLAGVLGVALGLVSRAAGARLGMAAESLVDLVALLLDDLSWDEVNLADEQDVQTLQRLSLYAHSLDEESLSQIRTGRGLLVFYALLGHEDQATLRALEAMEALCREDPAQFDQVQAMLRGYVLSRCRADSLPLGRDDRFVVCSMLAYVRFVDGVPDLRRLNALEQLIRQNCGERAMRHYEARLDDQRRRMSSHSIRRAKKNRWLFALYALLGLGAVGGAVLLVLRFIR